ncbi:uncharacterized protein EI97DRAFT_258266 [Westerdykella ornata]|uniref:Uncharacterized protein n=1 Tax=Westerdykella ornata TaxID=318751 RepID=A0A6A6J945_WESOR|nr:uncharacterized protein EI97DRAFT_258266 [Westerdykella ornata]KAF2271739.1 hypothetical protein EI97DRAFT_258266 [Westerdykella ornata]
MRSSLRTTLLLLPAIFLFATSVILFTLERISSRILVSKYLHTRNYISKNYMTFYGPRRDSDFGNVEKYDYIDVYIAENKGPTIAYIFLSLAGFLAAIIGACGVWELRRVEGTMGHQRLWAWFVLAVQGVVFPCVVVVLAWASVLQGNDGWKGYEDVSREGVVQGYTRETWFCQIDRLFGEQDWAGTGCGVAKATRFILIPLALSALLVMVAIYVLVRKRGGLRWLFGGKGRYAAFQSVYEMQPTMMPVPKYPHTPTEPTYR